MLENDPLVTEIGEIAAIRQATSQFRSVDSTLVGPGDDAAVVKLVADSVVITTDTMIENHDFSTDFSTPFALGYKAVATNVADVAAMGARPVALVVAMTVTRQTRLSWLIEFARGLQAGIDALAPEAAVVGGDLATADQIFISVTAHGDLSGTKPILRSGAKPGDLVAICGTLGKAAAGLDLLRHEDASLARSYPELVDVQLRPQPPIDLLLSNTERITSMLDVSDGLSLDASRLATASQVSLQLHSSSLDGFAAVLEQAAQSMEARDGKGRDPMDWVLHGGEDHGFLVTMTAGEVPRGFKVIGEVAEGNGVYLDGAKLVRRGWDSVSS